MKTTLKQLIFNDNFTRDDLIKCLMDGESFKYIKADKSREGAQTVRAKHLHYDKLHTNNPFRLDTNAWDFLGLKYLHEEIEQPWYEDPDAVDKPCIFWNDDNALPVISGFYYYHTSGHFQSRENVTYKHARLVTADDLYKGEL